MSLKQKILEKAKTIRGNELGWLIQLAENHLDSKTFQDYLKKNDLESTRQFLNRLLADFHPNNFNTGRSDTEWLLIKKDDVVGLLEEAFEKCAYIDYNGNPIYHCLECQFYYGIVKGCSWKKGKSVLEKNKNEVEVSQFRINGVANHCVDCGKPLPRGGNRRSIRCRPCNCRVIRARKKVKT